MYPPLGTIIKLCVFILLNYKDIIVTHQFESNEWLLIDPWVVGWHLKTSDKPQQQTHQDAHPINLFSEHQWSRGKGSTGCIQDTYTWVWYTSNFDSVGTFLFYFITVYIHYRPVPSNARHVDTGFKNSQHFFEHCTRLLHLLLVSRIWKWNMVVKVTVG